MHTHADIFVKNNNKKENVDYQSFLNSVNNNPDFLWIEEVSEYYRTRQKERENPSYKKTFVFNYKESLGEEFSCTYLEGNVIACSRKRKSDKWKELLEEFAKSLNAEIEFY